MSVIAEPGPATELSSDGVDPRRMRLAAEVAGLGAIERRTTTSGERRSAEHVAERLVGLGASNVELEPFRGHSTWAWPHSPLYLAAALGGLSGRSWGRVLAGAALVGLELDLSGRSHALRRFVPATAGVNATAELPARGAARRTLVVVAHHDAAHTGVIWHPRFLAAGRARAQRTGVTPSYSLGPVSAMAMCALAPGRARLLGAALAGLSLALSVQAGLSSTVAGANDNASGVAALFELARELADRPDDLRVLLLVPGGEEAGMVGMTGWLRRHVGGLDSRRTLVLGFDSVGSGTPVLSAREGLTGRFRDSDLALAERGADHAGVARPRRVGLGAGTDPLAARYAGLRAISLLSWRDGGIANLHCVSDVPANVDLDCVEQCVRLARGIVDVWIEEEADR
jgi:Peptidase family M28